MSQGCTDQQLRGVGHDLNSGLRSAERHKAFTRSPISGDDRLIIELINDYYSRREFEYVFLGFKSFPNPDVVRTLCELVHQNVKGSDMAGGPPSDLGSTP